MVKPSEESKARMSEAARKRWQKMATGDAVEMSKAVSQGMKEYWSRKSPEERRAIAKKAAESRRANAIKRLQEKGQ